MAPTQVTKVGFVNILVAWAGGTLLVSGIALLIWAGIAVKNRKNDKRK
jgi:hypothetical protein